MKTALSLNACAHHDDGAHRATAHTEAAGAGRLVPAWLYHIASGSFCTPSPGAADVIAKSSNGTCPRGWIASGSYCLRSGRRDWRYAFWPSRPA